MCRLIRTCLWIGILCIGALQGCKHFHFKLSNEHEVHFQHADFNAVVDSLQSYGIEITCRQDDQDSLQKYFLPVNFCAKSISDIPLIDSVFKNQPYVLFSVLPSQVVIVWKK